MADLAEENFEFAALNEAVNYRRALLQEFGPSLKGEVLEVGSGIGQLSEKMAALPGVGRLHAVEPNEAFFKELNARNLPIESTRGTVVDVAPDTFVNVPPPSVLTCHCTVGVGLPLAAAVKLAVLPDVSMTSVGLSVTTGAL